MIHPRRSCIVLAACLLAACKGDAPKKPNAPPKAAALSAEEAEQRVVAFSSAYTHAIMAARVHARQTGEARIEIDTQGRSIVVTDDKTGKPVKPFPYPEGVVVMKTPKQVKVFKNLNMDFDGPEYDHPVLMPDTAHVVAHVPGHPSHAVLRLYRTKEFKLQIVDLQSEP